MRVTPLLPLVLVPFALGGVSLSRADTPGTVPLAPAYQIAAKAGEAPRLFTVGTKGVTRLRGALALSNGEFLLTGAADDFSWAKGVSPARLTLPPEAKTLPGGGGTTAPFLLHVSADFETLKGLYVLPPGQLAEVTRIRSTEVPGQPTGALVISGRFAGLVGSDDAYWIARLDGNAVDRPIRGLEWLHVVKAPGDGPTKNKPAQPGDYAERQPWDVRSDGQVVLAEGEPFATTWAGLRVLSADGKPGVMPAWIDEGSGPILPLKAGRKGSLRSTTAEDFEHRQEDENGNPGRKGRYPDDYYFSAFDSDRGPGYTGYRLGQNATQRVSQLAIDRRDNALYFGTSTQTRMPDGLADFEPAIIALDNQGALSWWARGYIESPENSTPDQYVDCISVDYAADRLLVGARCHGNNNVNLWSGEGIRRNRHRPGFKRGFTGKNSDIHISWLGSYGLHDGKIYQATYVAELAEGGEAGRTLTTGNLAGWPDPNSWISVNTTRLSDLASDGFGRPALIGWGRRPYTTDGALQPNLKPTEGISRWSNFARLYEPQLTGLVYSTIVNSAWDPKTGKSPNDEVRLGQIVPLGDGFLTVGTHSTPPDGDRGQLPLTGAPGWATKADEAATAVGVVAFAPVPGPVKVVEEAPLEATKRRR